jgi:hypothetical protein
MERLQRATALIISAGIAAGCASAPVPSSAATATIPPPAVAASLRPSVGPTAAPTPEPTPAWGLFRAPVHIAAPIAPIVVVDFDGDGNLDIVGAKGDGSISLWLGAGDGTFAHARDFPGGEGPPQLAVADLNGDKRLDIILTHYGETDAGFTGSDDVVVLLAKKDGTFKRLVRPAGSSPQALAIGDFNSDGKPDLATANYADHASVFVGHGDGTFDDPLDVPISAPYASGIAAADLDGDGNLDLVTTNSLIGSGRSARSASVVLGRGDGTFDPAMAYPVGGPQPVLPVIVDLDGDGVLDIAMPDGWPTEYMSILFGDGDGTFAWSVEMKVGHNAHSLVATDLNGDVYTDLVAGSLNDGSDLTGKNGIAILFGAAGRSFEPKVEIWGPGVGDTIGAAADLDGDGKLDLIVFGDDDLIVLFNAIPRA